MFVLIFAADILNFSGVKTNPTIWFLIRVSYVQRNSKIDISSAVNWKQGHRKGGGISINTSLVCSSNITFHSSRYG